MDNLTKEAIRYLGYKNHRVDKNTLELIGESFQELDSIATKRMIYKNSTLNMDKNYIYIANMKIESNDLRKNLLGCEEVIILGATLGIQVDYLIHRYTKNEIAKAVVLQACAAAYLEEYLDSWQEEKRVEYGIEGKYLRPRFSPGYGDFNIKHQENIIRILDSAKTIGLSMTESYMLTPTKSVTAIIGIGKEKNSYFFEGCAICEKRDCEFRECKINKE